MSKQIHNRQSYAMSSCESHKFKCNFVVKLLSNNNSYMIRFIAALILSLTSFNLSIAQIAPDFTFTDVNGEVHNLQHALDQNYIVLVELFFADCGPCIVAATELQSIYEDYEGKNVLVWAISDIDDNERILQFQNEMGLEHTFGGIEGGGAEVFNELTSSNTFIAYPTVAVICPDGELTWDIFPYSEGAPEWRMEIEKCGVEAALPYEPYGSIATAANSLQQSESTLSLSPNPTNDFVKLSMNQKSLSGKLTVAVYNSFGQFLSLKEFAPHKNSNQEFLISTQDWHSGVYFLKVAMADEPVQVLRLVVE